MLNDSSSDISRNTGIERVVRTSDNVDIVGICHHSIDKVQAVFVC
jgi:hypothetical protein